jgi:DNA-binding PadR family transcriptional regulator
MHKSLLLLGLLRNGPRTGYDLHRIICSHGELYADLKKANVYYLLDRLAGEGYLDVQTEASARGPRGERLIYSLNERGRTHFHELLEQVLRSYEPVPSSIGAAIVFLPHLPEGAGIRLLEERRERVSRRRAEVATQNSGEVCGTLVGLAMDHLLALIDADLAWTDRALQRLREIRETGAVEHPAPAVSSPS